MAMLLVVVEKSPAAPLEVSSAPQITLPFASVCKSWVVPEQVKPVSLSAPTSDAGVKNAAAKMPPLKVEVAVEDVAMKYGAAMRLAYSPPENVVVPALLNAWSPVHVLALAVLSESVLA